MSERDAAADALGRGLPVILPTDTVYGLCADASREDAVGRLYRLKGRAELQPTALVAASIDALLACVPELDAHSETLAALLPGPFTLVLPNPAGRYAWLAGSSSGTIGVRVPALSTAVADVVSAVGCVAATSANVPGGPDPRRLEDVPAEIRSGAAAELDGGELPGIPSTVVDLTGDEPRVLREGAVSAQEAIARVSSTR